MLKTVLHIYPTLLLLFIMVKSIQSLKVQISATKSSYQKADSVIVVLQYENDHSVPVFIRPIYFPNGVLYDSILQVTLDGIALEYQGRVSKRPADTVDKCIEVKPGQSVNTTVDISKDYNLTESGTYRIGLNGDADKILLYPVQESGANGKKSNVGYEVSDAVVSIEGREYVSHRQEASNRGLGDISTCTARQKTHIRHAFSIAQTYAKNALVYLTNTTSGKRTRYVTWFGVYTVARWRTVRTNYQKIVQSFERDSYDIDCSCDQDFFAYVYSDEPFIIYVCNAFWTAPAGGSDSRAGTLIHEASHFTALIGTDDIAYGQTACKALAKTSPVQALKNADTHEYFAENTPRLL